MAQHDNQTGTSGTPTAKGLAFLGAVAGGLVHEIRNPLSTMNVTLQLLEEDLGDSDDTPGTARTTRRLSTLKREVRRLEEILDDFLRYAGIRRLNLARADLNRVLEEVNAFISPECARADIDLAFYPDTNLPLMSLDERLVKQAVLNLLLNAIQVIQDRPADEDDEHPRARQIIVRTALDGEMARVDVIDTGPGIPAHLLDRVFEVYYSGRVGGTGLGLPTARRIGEEHGGGLIVESEVGKGTHFVLRMPLAGPPRA